MSLAVDGQDGNGLQLEKLRLNFSSCFRASSNNRYQCPWFVSLFELNGYIFLLMFKENDLSGSKLLPLISRIVLGQKSTRSP